LCHQLFSLFVEAATYNSNHHVILIVSLLLLLFFAVSLGDKRKRSKSREREKSCLNLGGLLLSLSLEKNNMSVCDMSVLYL